MPKKKLFFAGPPPPPELHIRISSFLDSCTPVHGIQIFFIILMCSSGGGGGPAQKIIFFLAIFFQHVKKLINFWSFVKIKVAKFKLNHLG